MKKLFTLLILIILLFPNTSAQQHVSTFKLIKTTVETNLIVEVPIIYSRRVRATAYNACPTQTDDSPTICAWGDSVGEDVVAVSRDLEKIGLSRGVKLFVSDLGTRTVKDRMHKRKRNQIDLFMNNQSAALKFGVQYLDIFWVDSLIGIYEKSTIKVFQNTEGIIVTNRDSIRYQCYQGEEAIGGDLTDKIIKNLLRTNNKGAGEL